MSRDVLKKIEPIHAALTPPLNAVAAGVTPDGKQLYRLKTKMARSVPDLDPVTGAQKQRKNPAGVELYGLRKPELYEKDELFFLESQGNANVIKVPYRMPTPAEIAAETRRKAIGEMQPALAAALVDSGLTPEELVARLRGPAPVEVSAPTLGAAGTSGGFGSTDATGTPDAEPVEYPVHQNSNKWLLSDGSIARGNHAAAETAEAAVTDDARAAYAAALAKAKADTEAVPEV